LQPANSSERSPEGSNREFSEAVTRL